MIAALKQNMKGKEDFELLNSISEPHIPNPPDGFDVTPAVHVHLGRGSLHVIISVYTKRLQIGLPAKLIAAILRACTLLGS